MTDTPAPAPTATTSNGGQTSRQLVERIAVGDRAAFRCLYAFLFKRVWRTAIQVLPRPVDARAVTRATFVEVWHLARHHVDHPPAEVRTWIAAITARHVNERLRALDIPCLLVDDYDRHLHRELAELLGPGPSRDPNRPPNLHQRRRPRP
jgi:DNA-directed RNA polymerase specialized sigma24 family protein